MSRPVRGLLAALLCLPLLAAGAPTAAEAALLEGSGWWWRLQTGVLVEVPAPEQVPDGGLHVASSPDGATATAAIRFRLTAEEIDPVLTLVVADDRGGDVALLEACPAASPWRPAEAGRWEDRPEAHCEAAAVAGERADDGASWSFPLTGLVGEDRLDIVILPARLPDAPVGGWPSFELSFEPVDARALSFAPSGEEPESETAPPPAPDGEDLVFTPGPDPVPGDADAGAPPPPSPAGPLTASRSPSTPGLDSAEGEQADVGDQPVPRPETADRETEPPQGNGEGPPSPSEPATGAAVAPERSAGGESRRSDGLGLLLVVACAGAGMVVSGGAPRQPRPLGSFAQRRGAASPPTGEVRGIGRFAKPRDGRPPRL